MITKKTALACLALLYGAGAYAQSSVTLFGTMDVNVRRTINENESKTALATDGRSNSRLGFRGVEDLGGGLAASFWLEAQTTPDNGNANGVMFRRRSTVSLSSTSWGELRLGRDYTPTFWGVSAFDPFGHNGVGLVSNVDPHGPLGTFVRSDNSISYITPTWSGFFAQVMYAPTENAGNAGYLGARANYSVGALELRATAGRQYVNKQVDDSEFRTWTLGGRYDFGVATLALSFIHEDLEKTIAGIPPGTFKHWMIGTVVPVGPHEFKASYNKGIKEGGGADQFAVGYVYNLSKRTALYSNLSHLKNKGNFAQSVDGGLPSGQTPQVAGGKSRGFELGITHHF